MNAQPYAWINTWIGLPYEFNGRQAADGGYDCYGLLRAVLWEEYRIALPDWVVEKPTVGSIMRSVTEAVDNELAADHAVRVSDPVDLDVAVVRHDILAHHVGLYIAGGILHIASDMRAGSVFEPLDRFIATRGRPEFYRWRRIH
jgi:hypothetical protein